MSSELETRWSAGLRSPRTWLATLGIALLAVMYSGERVTLRTDNPYEGWDELGAYHDAADPTDSIHWRAYVYGTLDSLKEVLARWHYDRTDPIGQRYRIPIYSNNVPASWADRNFDFHVRDWTDLSAIDYTYFRGVADRRPVLLAREINLAFLYLLSAVIIVTAAALYGWYAAPVFAALLFCITSWEVLYASRFALPNADCALLAFLLCILCQAALGLGRPRLAYAAAVVLAVGVNHKVDFLALSLLLAITIACVRLGARDSFRTRLKYAATAGLWFGGPLILTNPYLLVAPHLEIRRQAAVLAMHQGSVDFNTNLGVFWHFLGMNFSATPGDPELPPRALITACFLAFALLAALPALRRKMPRAARLGTVGIVFLGAGALFILPVRNSVALYERYFLNGWAALLALAGGGAAIALAHFSRFRRSITIVGCLMLAPCIWPIGARIAQMRKVEQITAFHLDPETGLDKRSNRNSATIEALRLARAGGYSSTVLVDQHAYLDLRALLLARLTPLYINAENYQTAIGYLPPGRYLTLFTKGDYEVKPRWMGLWPENIRAKYDAYIRALSGLDILYERPGPLMKLLDWRPPHPEDNMTLAVISVGEKKGK